MMNKKYKIVKKIIKNTKIEISIIEINGKPYVMKRCSKNDDLCIDMLKNEADILANSEIEFIPKIYGQIFQEDDNYIIIEYIEGITLNCFQNENFENKIKLIFDLTYKLQRLHSNGIIHCDLKPTNVIITKNGDIKLIDFGISKTNDEYNFGNIASIYHCSKEQLQRENITTNTDLYSLGIIFYELIIGHNPFGKDKDTVKINKINDNFIRTNNDLLDLIFSKIFISNHPYKYSSIAEFQKDLNLFIK